MPGALAAGQLVDERYALEEALDEDALGTVWKALDRGLGRHVCVRDVAFAGDGWRNDDNQRRQALEAARTAIRLDHPGAVHVYDAFLDADRLVIVTELVKGRLLSSMVSRKGPLPAKRVAAMGLDLLEPLAAAHAIGLVHGAIAPPVVLAPDRDRFLLSGFGLAPRFLDATSTAWVVQVGTAACVAPEQAKHRGSAAASDLWSLGATLYYAVEGTHAFSGETAGDVLDAVVESPLRPPTRAGRLAPLLEQMLEKDPDARPQPDEIRRQLIEVAGVPLPLRSLALQPSPEPDDGEEAAAPAEAETITRRRRWRGRRAAPEPDLSDEDGVEPATVDEHDWSAVVAGATSTETGETTWRDWTPADGTVDGSDQWRLASDTAGAPLAAVPEGEVPEAAEAAQTVGEGGEATPASDGAPEAEEPRRFRSTPSWPPPERRRKGIVILCTVVMIVMVALLVTDGRIGRGRARSRTNQAAQQRPVLATDPANVPANWITYRHVGVDFGTSYPPGWVLREEGQVVTIRDPATGTQLRIDYSAPPGPDPEETWTELERSFSAQHPSDYRRLQLSPATYLGHTAALWEFTYVDGNALVHAVDLGFVTKKYRFALFFEAQADAWQTMLPTFRGFLSSFKAPK